jgi:hypothetical protein
LFKHRTHLQVETFKYKRKSTTIIPWRHLVKYGNQWIKRSKLYISQTTEIWCCEDKGLRSIHMYQIKCYFFVYHNSFSYFQFTAIRQEIRDIEEGKYDSKMNPIKVYCIMEK